MSATHEYTLTAPLGIFYGSSTCYTEMAAEKIAAKFKLLADVTNIDLHNIADCELSAIEDYPLVLLGIPTWDYGELQEDWEAIWDELDNIDMSGRHIALFGLGDQIGYPQWFLDAMGYLHDKLVAHGAIPLGYWPSAEFSFEESKALTEDGRLFVGLALDEENEFDKTEQRIDLWCKQVLNEYGQT